ncbi:MAG: beta-N-acetylhexosaminidase [Anaerohalosphaera sp.]|nr:beta-N-acetylhexosaminidase [Anaerohalosphaera sp.]
MVLTRLGIDDSQVLERLFRTVFIILAGVLLFVFPAAAAGDLSAAITPTVRDAARASLIPYPQEVKWSNDDLTLGSVRLKYYPSKEGTLPDGDFLIAYLEDIIKEFGVKVADSTVLSSPVPISLRYGVVPKAKGNPEAYQLVVESKKVDITASTPGGLFNGIATLRQLIQYKNDRAFIPCCEIVDWPAFLYRGFMHDVGRNFQDVDLIKQHLDLMARYKLNLFHFHLTDRPGYRIECKKYPELNDPANYRSTRQPGKYYTYDQINDLIKYARQRNIQIIPEIDMPGHSEYFNNTFGFDMQDPRGIKILKEILAEFFEHVDTPLFHMGSDEVRLKNPAFMKEIVDFIRSKGKKTIVWRPGHLPDKEVITQLWSRSANPVENVPYLDSRANYINHMDAFVGPIRTFFQQPCRVPQGNDMALGGVLCHWPDINVNTQMDIYTQSPVYSAMLAYAERIWRGSPVSREDCWAKLPAKTDSAFQEFASFEDDMIVHRDSVFKDIPFPYVKQAHIPWKLIGPFDHQGNPQKRFSIEESIRDEYSINGKTYHWIVGHGGTIHINHFFGFQGHLPAAKSGTAYGLTYIHSPKDQEVSFWIGFNGYSRSGSRGGPNPSQGEWSNVYSKVLINDKAIAPPKWKQPEAARKSGEIPLVDEDYFYRLPIQVSLNKGWNKILVKAPKAKPAWKWMFTCVPVRYNDGRYREANDLTFSLTPETDL